MRTTLEKETSRIADAIVELVEQTDGPITLLEVDRKVAGFSEEGDASWRFVKEKEGKETIYWSGMTEAGFRALSEVIDGRKVAVQLVTAQPYHLCGGFLRDPNWQPILLLPARAANLDGPSGLLRVPPASVSDVLPKPGWKQLTPKRVHFTVDRFSI